MNFEFRDLRGNHECASYRKHNIPLMVSTTEPMKKAAFEKKLIRGLLDGMLKEADIEPLVEAEFETSSMYRSKDQARLKAMDTTAEIKRCYRSIKDNETIYPGYMVNTSPVLKDITVTIDGEDVVARNVKPDLVATYGNTTVAVKLHIGKPKMADGRTLTDDNDKFNKSRYFLMRYAKAYAEDNGAAPGDPIVVTGADWYLAKNTDKRPLVIEAVKDPKDGPHFDKSLFYDEKDKVTGNIRTTLGFYKVGVQEECKIDTEIKDTLKKFVDGLDRDECTKEQCGNCIYDEICHYTQAPQALETEEKAVDLSLVKLSPVQESIKDFNFGYGVVNAGPGSGKTFILCLNACELMLSGAKPEEIILIAFSHSAAQVFRERIEVFNEDIGTGEDISGMKIVTFNEFGNEILQEEFQHFGFARPPRVIQQIERFGIIEHILNTHNKVPDLDYRNFELNMKMAKGPLAVASMVFDKIKRFGFSEFDGEAIANAVNPPRGKKFCSVEAATALAKLYSEYDNYLKERGLIEFADQEMLLLDLLHEDPYYFDKFGFKHVLVDEAQDTSGIQFEILRHLTQSPSFESIMLVGDDSQSIYGFRDADPEGFMSFERRMGLPKGTVQQFYMMDNFRSTPEILDFANRIIENNLTRVDKKVISNKKNGKGVECHGFYSRDDEYNFIVDEIKKRIENGMALEDIAFIASSRTELMQMASRLTEEGINSVLLNPEILKDNSRVQAGLAFSRCIQDPQDTKDILVCLNAIYDGGLFDFSDDEILKMIAVKQEEYQKIHDMPVNEQKKAFFDELSLFGQGDEIYDSFVESLQNQPTLDLTYQYCRDFDLYGDREEKRRECNYPGVVLTTAHSSKGMEWKVVFNTLTKYDEKEIHTERGNRNTKDIEEKRRLLFVSATRAKDELIVTGQYVAFGGYKDAALNIFLEEAFKASGEKWDEEVIKRGIQAKYQKKKEDAAKRRKIEQEKLAELAKADLKNNSDVAKAS